MTGEFKRIDLFLKAFREAGGRTSGGAVSLGPGDDAAVLSSPRPLAITTDAIVEGVHFRSDWASAREIGHKALAVNLSDLAAMGARPIAFTCALALPPACDDARLAELARGMAAVAGPHGAVLAGGNFTRASELSITITAIGEIAGEPLRRDAARPGDVVLLVGAVGVAAAQLRELMEGRALPAGRSALHQPEPLVQAGLLAAGRARCGIDVSDGLAQDLGHVARASGVRILLKYEAIPRDPRFVSLASTLPSQEQARLLLAGGEDYALVLTAPADRAMELAVELGATAIGVVEEGRGIVIEGLPENTRLEGHDHFAA